MMQELMLSCDWGTTSFRLSLVDMQTHQVMGAVRNTRGTVFTFEDWKMNGQQQGISREDFYLGRLKEQIVSLWQESPFSPEIVPMVISGMAGSSLGIRELQYVPLPFSIDGSDVISQQIACPKDIAKEVLLLSGASHQTDVMRGEETQIIGLSSLYEINPMETTICIFPGTHSKHITVQNGKIIDFHTYMTGELFAVMQQHSILKESISKAEYSGTFTKPDQQSFCLGLEQSTETNLLRSLFSVRINQLFSRLDGRANFFYLSGLLIGTELRSIPQDVHIMLCSSRQMGDLYELALQQLALSPRAVVIPADQADTLAMEGHIKILKRKNECNQ
jgi:2-dehydro-3-deoxygalactonokinase